MALSTRFATAGLPSTVNQAALIDCLITTLYDSGKFSLQEVQKITAANSQSDLSSDLAQHFTDDVINPCVEKVVPKP